MITSDEETAVPLQYTNRKGKTFFLHVGVTKTGKPKYYLAQDPNGPLAEQVPEGFEIYENPNCQVFVRKKLPKLISDTEMQVVENVAKGLSTLKYCRLERKLKALTVYTGDQPDEMYEEIVALGLRKGRNNIEESLSQFQTYSPNMQFLLVDEQQRIFQTQRFCYRGSIDDWIYIGSPGSLVDLAQQYLPHLGQDSFYELF